MFERYHEPLISTVQFRLRIMRCVFVSVLLTILTVSMGVVAYHFWEHLSWLDSTVNAVCVMTGIGLTVTLQTTAVKIFTCFYAILSAIMFFSVLAILLSPLFHRFLHRFHLDLDKR